MPFWVWDYYSPGASDGTVTKSTCQRSVGPPDRLQIVRNEVVIGVTASEVKDGVLISIEIEIPAGKDVQLKKPFVIVSTPLLKESFSGTLKHADINNSFPLDINEQFIGGTREQKLFFGQTRTIYNTYMLRANVSMPRSKLIKIILPELYINNEEMLLPEMTFSKDKYLEFFVPINC